MIMSKVDTNIYTWRCVLSCIETRWGVWWGRPRWTRWSAEMQSVRISSPTLWKAAYRSRGPWVTATLIIISPAQANTRPMSVVVIPCPLSPPRYSQNIHFQMKCIQWSNIQIFSVNICIVQCSYSKRYLWYVLFKWSCVYYALHMSCSSPDSSLNPLRPPLS